MSHSVASDLGLHCLPLSHKKDARLIWVYIKHDYYSYITKARIFLLIDLRDFFSDLELRG